MTFKDVVKWKNRMALVYAVGVWTMVGSYAYTYYLYSDRDEETPVTKVEEEVQEPGDPNQAVYRTAHSKTTIVYKKDFVPFTTKIYNLFRSSSGEPGTGDK